MGKEKLEYWTCLFCGKSQIKDKIKYCNCCDYKATKENALKLISHFYDKVCENHTTNKKYFDEEFYCYEQIAKGYAMLEVCKSKDFNENQKKEMYKFIRQI